MLHQRKDNYDYSDFTVEYQGVRFGFSPNRGMSIIISAADVETFDFANPSFIEACAYAKARYSAETLYSQIEAAIEPESGSVVDLKNAPDDVFKRIDSAIKAFIKADFLTEFPEFSQTVLDVYAALEKARDKRGYATESPYFNGYVYLLQSPTSAYKIGRTKNPNDRLATFSVKLPFEVEFIALIPADDMYALERELHNLFSHKRVNGEWFNLAPDDVEYIKSLAVSNV